MRHPARLASLGALPAVGPPGVSCDATLTYGQKSSATRDFFLGSANTGLSYFQNTERTRSLLRALIWRLRAYDEVDDFGGGENQLLLDRLGFADVPFGSHRTVSVRAPAAWAHQARSLPYEAPRVNVTVCSVSFRAAELDVYSASLAARARGRRGGGVLVVDELCDLAKQGVSLPNASRAVWAAFNSREEGTTASMAKAPTREAIINMEGIQSTSAGSRAVMADGPIALHFLGHHAFKMSLLRAWGCFNPDSWFRKFTGNSFQKNLEQLSAAQHAPRKHARSIGNTGES